MWVWHFSIPSPTTQCCISQVLLPNFTPSLWNMDHLREGGSGQPTSFITCDHILDITLIRKNYPKLQPASSSLKNMNANEAERPGMYMTNLVDPNNYVVLNIVALCHVLEFHKLFLSLHNNCKPPNYFLLVMIICRWTSQCKLFMLPSHHDYNNADGLQRPINSFEDSNT